MHYSKLAVTIRLGFLLKPFLASVFAGIVRLLGIPEILITNDVLEAGYVPFQ